MEQTDDALRAKLRWAYEWNRLSRATWSAIWVAPMVVFSLLAAPPEPMTALAATALFAFAVGFRWWGRALGRAVLPGLLAGSLPLVLPLVFRATGYCCIGGTCWSGCMLGCIAGGAFAGAMIGIASVAERDERTQFLGAATLLAGIAGSLGCAMVGTAGIAGMILAVIGSSVPVAAALRLRSAE